MVDAMVGAIFGMEGTGPGRLYHGLLGLQWAIEGSAWNAAHFTSDACYDSSFSNSINENLLTRAGLLT